MLDNPAVLNRLFTCLQQYNDLNGSFSCSSFMSIVSSDVRSKLVMESCFKLVQSYPTPAGGAIASQHASTDPKSSNTAFATLYLQIAICNLHTIVYERQVSISTTTSGLNDT